MKEVINGKRREEENKPDTAKINVISPSPSRNEIILTGSEILLGKPS